MNIRIDRLTFEEEYTMGRVFINDDFICNSLEDKVRELGKNGEGKVPEKTAIPAEKYKFRITFWPKYQIWTPALIDVPFFTGIRLHSGRNAEDTHGCILIGQNTFEGKLEHGYNTFENFMKYFNKNENGTYNDTLYEIDIINKKE